MTVEDFMNSDSMGGSAPSPVAPGSPSSDNSMSLADFSGGDISTLKTVTNPQDIPKPKPQMQDVQPAIIPTGLFSSNKGFMAGLAAPVMDALTSSEQNVGSDIGGLISEMSPGVKTAQDKAQAAKQQSMSVYNQLVAKRHQMFQAGEDTTQIDASIASAAKTFGITGLENILPQAAQKTSSQVVGDFGGVAMDLLASGTLQKGAESFELLTATEKAQLAEKGITSAADAEKALSASQKYADIAKTTAKGVATGAGLGYGYDVTQNLQKGQTATTGAFKPGMGTVIGASVPALFGLYEAGKLTAKQLAPAIDNWTMRALPKQFRYGANPGKTVAEMGISGNSLEDWGANVKKAVATQGKTIGKLADTVAAETGDKTIDLTDQFKPLNDAIQKAAKNNDTAAMGRLQDAKQALEQEMRAGNYVETPTLDENGVPLPGQTQKTFTEGATDKEGKMVAGSIGARDLSKTDFSTVLDVKRQVGELTKWTGNVSDDKTVNMALKKTYGGISDALEDTAKGTSVGNQFAEANQKYNDLKTADIAIQRAQNLASSKQILGFGEKIAGATAILTAIATQGTAAVPEIIAGVAGDALLHALNSVAVKTRVASWLASEAPGKIEQFLEENPETKNALYSAFMGGKKATLSALIKVAKGLSQPQK